MRTTHLLVCTSLLAFFLATPASAVGPPPIPIACSDQPYDCQCLCNNNYDPFWAYWESGCSCGDYTVRVVECQFRVGVGGPEDCWLADWDASGECFYSEGQCYGWGTCVYAGP